MSSHSQLALPLLRKITRVPGPLGYYDSNINSDCFGKYSLTFKVNLLKRPWLSTHSLTPFNFIFQMSASVSLFNNLKWISSWLMRLHPKRFQVLPKIYIQLVILYYIAMYHFLMCIPKFYFTTRLFEKKLKHNKAEIWEGSDSLSLLRPRTKLNSEFIWLHQKPCFDLLLPNNKFFTAFTQ